jgi:hypothetical protein
MQAILNIIYVFLAAIVLIGLLYIVSQVQMNGWLKQIDKFLNEKLKK